MAQKRNAGPMSVQPERCWSAVPVGETAPANKPRLRLKRLSAKRAGLLRQQALRMQRALLAGKSDGRKFSPK
ncbi:hypothetical protein [Bradyrhizobium betae]|uniref:Uncharacterized protein n=1 Tax=Bradyrhizobium betae TaxID=244734 RepID=A0A5P6PAU9_9BRAD|nr:hypothetical protein [Bradyrhizobium betae]QFI75178.1 hypothetical protein F8237_23875 [Bradyrhizobium betae]